MVLGGGGRMYVAEENYLSRSEQLRDRRLGVLALLCDLSQAAVLLWLQLLHK